MIEVITFLQGINLLLLGIGIRKLFDIYDKLGDTRKEVEGLKQWSASHEKKDDERWELLTKGLKLRRETDV